MTIQLTNTIETIIENICGQLIAFQHTIATKPEDTGIPTLAEINMQCRLINCIDKLRRYHAKLVKAAVTDDEQENLMMEMPSVPPLINNTHIADTEELEIDTKNDMNFGISNQYIPFSERDFIDYRHLMGTFGKVTDTCTVKFRGRYVNAKWLEYNLFQYTRPFQDRRFISDAQFIASEIDYNGLQEAITLYNNRREYTAA